MLLLRRTEGVTWSARVCNCLVSVIAGTVFQASPLPSIL